MSKTKTPNVRVVHNEGEEIQTEILADAIVELSKHMQAIFSGRLNKRAILVLLRASSGLPMCDIEKVLNSLATLQVQYTKG